MSTPAASSTPVAPPAAAPPRKWTPQEIAAFPVCTKIAAYNGKPCRAKRVPWQRACNCGGCPCHCFCFSTEEKRQKYERNIQNAQRRNEHQAARTAAQTKAAAEWSAKVTRRAEEWKNARSVVPAAAPPAAIPAPPTAAPPAPAPPTSNDVCPTLAKYGYCSCGNETPAAAGAAQPPSLEGLIEKGRATLPPPPPAPSAGVTWTAQAAAFLALPTPTRPPAPSTDEKDDYDFADEEEGSPAAANAAAAAADAAWLKIPVGEFRPPVPIHDRRWLREENRDMLVMFISLHELTLRGIKKMKGWKRCDDANCEHMDCFVVDISRKFGW